MEKELKGVEAKLARADFVDKAPADIVEKERQKAAALRERRATLRTAPGRRCGRREDRG